MAQVSKWGNSLAVRLPSKIVKALDLKEGDEVTMGVSEGGAEFVVRKQDEDEARRARIQAAFDAMDKAGMRLPDDFKFDRDEANGWERFDKWGPDRR